MPFPIIIPLAVAAAKATTSYAAWYWGGAGIVGSGGLFYLFFKRSEPEVDQLPPLEPALHKIGEKIDFSLEGVVKTKLELSGINEQSLEELAKAEIDYNELLILFKKLNSGLLDAKELEEVIEKISNMMRDDSTSIDALKLKVLGLKQHLNPTQQYSLFNSTEFQRHQAEMKAMVEVIVDSGAELDARPG